jgi:hypothetical protein
MYIWYGRELSTLRENKTLPCDKSHSKGTYMPGKVFAVCGRTATSARQRSRRQRGHCRALRVVCTATSLPCVLSFAVSPRVSRAAKRCRASTTLPCDKSLPCVYFAAVRLVSALRLVSAVPTSLPCVYFAAVRLVSAVSLVSAVQTSLPCALALPSTAKPPPGTPSASQEHR